MITSYKDDYTPEPHSGYQCEDASCNDKALLKVKAAWRRKALLQEGPNWLCSIHYEALPSREVGPSDKDGTEMSDVTIDPTGLSAANEVLYGGYSYVGSDLEQALRSYLKLQSDARRAGDEGPLTDRDYAVMAVESWLDVYPIDTLVAAVRQRMAQEAHDETHVCGPLCTEHGDPRETSIIPARFNATDLEVLSELAKLVDAQADDSRDALTYSGALDIMTRVAAQEGVVVRLRGVNPGIFRTTAGSVVLSPEVQKLVDRALLLLGYTAANIWRGIWQVGAEALRLRAQATDEGAPA